MASLNPSLPDPTAPKCAAPFLTRLVTHFLSSVTTLPYSLSTNPVIASSNSSQQNLFSKIQFLNKFACFLDCLTSTPTSTASRHGLLQ